MPGIDWEAFEEAHGKLAKLRRDKENHDEYERLRLQFTLALLNNNDLLHERSFKEICELGVEFTEEYIKHELGV